MRNDGEVCVKWECRVTMVKEEGVELHFKSNCMGRSEMEETEGKGMEDENEQSPSEAEKSID
jgi:hypothetical protein